MARQRTVFRYEEIPALVAGLRPFLSEGKLPDGTRRMSAYSSPVLGMGHLPRRFHATVRLAEYVVYSYGTPIAWVWDPEANGDDRGNWTQWFEVPDIGYSPTTGQHQALVLEAWADHMRSQGTYRSWPASHREVVGVPSMADTYGGGGPRRRYGGGPRSGGIDDPYLPPQREPEHVSAYSGVSGDAMHWSPGSSTRAHP